jgi:hypothetical protein
VKPEQFGQTGLRPLNREDVMKRLVCLGLVVIVLTIASGIAWLKSSAEVVEESLPVTVVTSERRSEYRPATVAITVLDPGTDRWFTTAQLYLKIESSLEPGVAQLLPVNIGSFNGRNEVIHETCFSHQRGRRETLVLEWLDDQTMSSDQRTAVLNLINDGGTILTDLARIWLLRRGVYNRRLGLKDAINTFGAAIVGADVRQFKSFGRAEYNVPDVPPTSYQESNAITVLHQQTKAKAELRFYYTPR